MPCVRDASRAVRLRTAYRLRCRGGKPSRSRSLACAPADGTAHVAALGADSTLPRSRAVR